jgi:hypothetical protein
MKLNPPASSSDLDAARAIARRLHRRARGHERATDRAPEAPAAPDEVTASPVATTEVPPFPPTAPESATFEPAAPEPVPVEPAVPEPAPEEPTAPEPEAFEPAAPDSMPVEPAVPESALGAPATPVPAPFEPGPGPGPFGAPAEEAAPFEHPDEGDALAGFAETPEDKSHAPEARTVDAPPPELPAEPEGPEEAPAPPDPWASQATPAEGMAPVEVPPEDVTAPDEIAPDSAFGDLEAAEVGPALEGLEPPAGAGSAEDLLGDTPGPEWPEDNPLEAQIGAEPERAPDDVVSSAAPSWDDVADSCRALAQVHGAMIVDPSGQILAARGSWPEPGPEAIGGRLVSMMEKTLQDAPTRSVSAPLAGQHLTAWRVPASDGYYTVVFMGDAPLGADVRSPVDVEIKQALGQ